MRPNGQDATTKRGRWEAELAGPPSERSPTASGSALVHSTQVHGGALTVAGRDNNNNNTTIHNHTYIYGTPTVSVDVLEILNSLSLPNFRDIQLDTLAKATDGTCIWLTRGELFVFWVKHGKILWGIGIPGAGKTVLASIVIRYLEGLENTSGGVICVAYVYLRYSEPLAIRDILESMVKQIIERHDDLISTIEALYARHEKEKTKPSQQDLVEVLEGFIRYGKTLFFVLDAFDEMRAEDRPILLNLLASLDAKLFITSRPLEPLQQQFPYARLFNIAANPSDLNLHIKYFLRHSPEVMALLEGTDLEEQIAETIHQKSGGMFLHANLQLEALRNCVSAHDVKETLQAFPSDIKGIYAKTWERILAQVPKHSNLAKLVLLWITHANGEMTIDTLRRAVATCPKTYAFETKRVVPEALLLSVCCGLVSVDEKTRLARLILPHALLGHICIVHLTKCGFQHYGKEPGARSLSSNLNDWLQNDTLLGYAYQSWAHHTSQCGRYTPITSAAADLVLNCTSYPFEYEWRVDFGGPLHVAAFYGLETLIPLAAQLHSPNSGTTNFSKSPLILAAKRGHLGCAKVLLSLPGIDVNRCNGAFHNAFTTAAIYGHIEIIQLLAEVPGIDINAVDVGDRTALMWAAAAGHTEVVKLFIRLPGIDINAANRDGWTALMHAVHQGHGDIVKEFLSTPGIEVNCASFLDNWSLFNHTKMWTALMMAASKGHVNIVKQLLEVPGINVNAASFPEGKTALSFALAVGHREIVDLLLAFPGTVVPASPNWIQNQRPADSNDEISGDDDSDEEDDSDNSEEDKDDETGDEFHDE
ncbi:ankyrin repeat domain-containing protein 28 [Coprinopsis sp. MPI-PUGE-AT-0042]|nr:ankyrin repeat domain-containing protein 28 [Coprinopsis sp. MPI-PUGE-AT-0042]